MQCTQEWERVRRACDERHIAPATVLDIGLEAEKFSHARVSVDAVACQNKKKVFEKEEKDTEKDRMFCGTYPS